VDQSVKFGEKMELRISMDRLKISLPNARKGMLIEYFILLNLIVCDAEIIVPDQALGNGSNNTFITLETTQQVLTS
jgi:hypothetical protein